MSAPKPPPPVWLQTAEAGTMVGIRTLLFLATLVGRKRLRPVLYGVALWYALLNRGVRRASRDWLRRVMGRAPQFQDIIRHIETFAQTALDRSFFLQGRVDLFEVTHVGQEHLEELHRQKRGAILLSAHIGSTAAMSAESRDERLRIRVVGYFKNAQRFNDALTALNPSYGARLVHIEPGEATSVLEMRDRVEAGEILALAGDRVGLNDRTIDATFFGESAPFPAGPFLFAAMMRCPVYLAFGLYSEPNRYELYCEPFVDRVDLPRKDRDAALAAIVQRYATRLEHYARLAPYNWFNFFDFWSRS